MKKVSIDNYDFYPYHNLSRSEWLQIRNSFNLCLGGSDMSVVCEHNEYTTKAKLFDEKLGLIEPTDLSDNQRVFWGTIQEPVLRVVSQYYDLYGEKNNYLMNMKDFNISSSNTRSGYKVNIDGGNNKVYRKHLAFDFTTQNKKLHWLFANIDGMVTDDAKTDQEVINKIEKKKKFVKPKSIIELKTMDKTVYDKWNSTRNKGLPEGYIDQIMMYMATFLDLNEDLDSYIFVLVNGNGLVGYHIEYNQYVVDFLLEKSYQFYNLLLHGQDIINNSKDDQQMKMGLDEIRPEADDSLAYQNYMNKNYLERLDPTSKMIGDDKILEIAERYTEITKKLSQLNKDKRYQTNLIRSYLNENEVKKVLLPYEKGYISCYKNLVVRYNE